MNDDTKLEELRNRFRTIQGEKTGEKSPPAEPAEKKIPENVYAVLDVEGNEWINTGFLIFTSHHIAIMTETEEGAMPVFVIPLDRVRAAELVHPDELELDS